MRRVVAALALTLAVLPVDAQTRAPWDGWAAWLWTFGDRAIDAGFATRIRSLGIAGIQRDGTTDASMLRGLGLRYWVGHAVAKRVLTLGRDAFEARWQAYWTSRSPSDLERPDCLCRDDVRARLRADLHRTIAAHTEHEPVAYSLGDEISVTRRVVPLDFSHSDAALASFRSWLRERYATLEALNGAWDTAFASWSAVLPMTADAIRRRELRRAPDTWNLRPWDDHRAFTDHSLAALIAMLRAEARRAGVTAPVGFLGGQAPAPYGGYDWSRLVGAVDWVEAYDEGGAMEVIRGLAPMLPQVRTYFPADDERLNVHRLWHYFAHGDRGAILWSDRTVLDGDGETTAFARAIAPTLRTLAGPLLAGVDPGMHVDPVALYYSQRSIRTGWMRDSRRDGKTWMKRFGSYERTHASQYRSRIAWHRLLEDCGVQYAYVSSRDPLGATHALLVLPSVHTMSAAEVDRVVAWLGRGGRIACDVVPAALGRALAERPDLTERVTHIAGDVGDVLAAPDGPRPDALRKAVRAALAAAGVAPVARVRRADGRDGGIELIRRSVPGGTAWFVLRNLTDAETRAMRGDAWDDPVDVTLELPAPVRWARVDPSAPAWPTAFERARTIRCRVSATAPALLFMPRDGSAR